MSEKKTKCIAVQLPLDIAEKLEEFCQNSKKSKNSMLIEFITNGLKGE